MDKYRRFVDVLLEPVRNPHQSEPDLSQINWRRAEVLSSMDISGFIIESRNAHLITDRDAVLFWHAYRCFQAAKGEFRVPHYERLEADAANGDLISQVYKGLHDALNPRKSR